MAIPYESVNPNRFQTMADYSGLINGIGRFAQDRRERQDLEQKKAEQQAQLENQNARLSEAASIFQTGDTDAMAEYMIKNPDLRATLLDSQKFVNENTKAKRLESLQRVAMGEPAAKVSAETSQFIKENGGTTEETDAFGRLPQEQAQKAALAELAIMMEPAQFKNFAQSLGASNPDLDIKRETLDIRRAENEQRYLDRALSRETNDLKREELSQRIDANKAKISNAAVDAVATVDASIEAVDRLMDHKGLNAAVGLSSVTPTIPGGNAADFEAILENVQSRAFLSEVEKMKGLGALTEAEGKKLVSAVGALRLDMSEKQFRDELSRIKNGYIKAKKKLESRLPADIRPEPSAPEVKTVNWADL